MALAVVHLMNRRDATAGRCPAATAAPAAPLCCHFVCAACVKANSSTAQGADEKISAECIRFFCVGCEPKCSQNKVNDLLSTLFHFSAHSSNSFVL